MAKKPLRIQPAPKVNFRDDPEGDVLDSNFGQPQPADEAEMTDEGIVIRLRDGQIVGFTVPNAKEKLYESSKVLETYAQEGLREIESLLSTAVCRHAV